ncbi:MAG: hypothetical protein ACI4HI_16300 [Lachnospiraceae bacterium]
MTNKDFELQKVNDLYENAVSKNCKTEGEETVIGNIYEWLGRQIADGNIEEVEPFKKFRIIKPEIFYKVIDFQEIVNLYNNRSMLGIGADDSDDLHSLEASGMYGWLQAEINRGYLEEKEPFQEFYMMEPSRYETFDVSSADSDISTETPDGPVMDNSEISETLVEDTTCDLTPSDIAESPAMEDASMMDEIPAMDEAAPTMDEIPAMDEVAPMTEEAPIMDNISATEEAAPIMDEVPGMEEAAPMMDETPIMDEASIMDEAPSADEAPLMDETPIMDEIPGMEEATPMTEEAPAMEETTPIMDDSPVPEETTEELTDADISAFINSLDFSEETASEASENNVNEKPA